MEERLQETRKGVSEADTGFGNGGDLGEGSFLCEVGVEARQQGLVGSRR